MVCIEIRFPAGRYHSTAWNHHANEGRVEWPPSPYRLLRALIATWHLKCADDVSARDLDALLEALSEKPPEYRLPAAVASHTRHYMPTDGNTTKVLDSFLVIPRSETPTDPCARLGAADAVVVCWPGIELNVELQDALARLVTSLGYLGRAESWVECRLLEEAPELNCRVSEDGEIPAGQDVEDIFVPLDTRAFAEFRAQAFEAALHDRLEAKRAAHAKKGKAGEVTLTKADRARVEQSIPASLREALGVESAAMRKAGWSMPPGVRRVGYLRPTIDTAGRSALERRSRSLGSQGVPTVARFAIAGSVLPSITRGLHFAEHFRAALIKEASALGLELPVFMGKEEVGEEARVLKGHTHAYVLPEAGPRTDKISFVTLYAQRGFDRDACRVLQRVRLVYGYQQEGVQVALLTLGQPGDVAEHGSALFAKAATWRWVTPFVPTRHAKRKRNGSPRRDVDGLQIGAPDHDLVRLLEAHGYPRPLRVVPEETMRFGGRIVRVRDFATRRRRGGGTRASLGGYGFRLEFSEPVQGPLVLGYGAHFGLGAFVAVSGSD